MANNTGYKRKVYLINPRFQLKFSFYVCLILFVATLIYPVAIFDLIGNFSNFVAAQSPEIAQRLRDKKGILTLILVLWQLGFTALVFILCIFFSHKIAGPLYKLTRFLSDIRLGGTYRPLSFRKGDYFQEIAQEFNLTLEYMQENYKKDFVYLSEVNTYLNNLGQVLPEDKKKILGEISKRLSEIQNRFSNNT